MSLLLVACSQVFHHTYKKWDEGYTGQCMRGVWLDLDKLGESKGGQEGEPNTGPDGRLLRRETGHMACF